MSNDPIKTELWRRGQLTWKMHKGQALVYKSLTELPPSVREAVVFISRRWGKSYLGILMALMDCLKHEGRQVFIVGPTIKQTLRIVVPLINEISQDAPGRLIVRTKSEALWRVGNSTLIIGAFDTAIESFRGLRADAIYIEESGQANPENYEYIIRSVLRPTLMHSKGRMIHLTTPALEIDHPLHTMTIPQCEIDGAFFKYTIHDNPLLSKEDIEDEIKAMGGIDSPHCQRELFCELVKDEQSLIVPEFTDKYVKPLVVPDYTFFQTSIDFGGSRDKHAILLSYYDFIRAKVCILDEEFLDVNTGTDTIVALTKAMEERNKVVWLDTKPRRVIDAPGQTHVDIKRLDFHCSPPLKGRDSVLEGINALRVAFLQGEIEIHPRCKNLIHSLKYGRWDKNKKDFLRTKDLGHCDMIASLVYNYRHINKTSNPIPPNLGKHPHTHYYTKQKETDTTTALEEAFKF